MENFSDGVFAIAATLLVLEIGVSQGSDAHLGRALLDLWPGYLAYATSFLIIGIIWVNHHDCVAGTACRRLIAEGVPQSRVDAISRAFDPGVPLYLVVLVLAFFSPLAAVVLTLALAAFYVPSGALFERMSR
jgi:hypothetical protein